MFLSETFIYYKFFILLLIIFFCGIGIVNKLIKSQKFGLIVPLGICFGFAFLVFINNLIAHFIKGQLGIIVSLVIFILLSYKIGKNTKLPLIKHQQQKFYFSSIIFWIIFLYKISSTAQSNGADTAVWYPLAHLFAKGDYPMHIPISPDYVQLYHSGSPMLLGIFKSLTNAPISFSHNFISYILLICWTQIITWGLFSLNQTKSFSKLIIASIPAMLIIISLGGITIAIPTELSLPQINSSLWTWLNSLPRTATAYYFPSPGDIDNMIYYFHRLLGVSFLLTALFIILNTKASLKFTAFCLTILLSAIALTDESIFFFAFPSIALITFLFHKDHLKPIWIFVFILIGILISIQGGYITETILNRYGSGAKGSLFASKDKLQNALIAERFQQYTFHVFNNTKNLKPFSWIFIGGLYQSLILFILSIYYYLRKKFKIAKILFCLFVISASALFTYFAIIPAGRGSVSSQRFLSMSILFSGLGLGYFLTILYQSRLFIKLIMIWILITSILPSFTELFPREPVYWFSVTHQPNPLYDWIEQNLDYKDRIIFLTYDNLLPVSNMHFQMYRGGYTPLWDPDLIANDDFDVTPSYADIYTTLDPVRLERLGIKYIVINTKVFQKLPKTRQEQLFGSKYFQIMSISPNSTVANFNYILFKIDPSYIFDITSLPGTLLEFENQIKSSYKQKYYLDNADNLKIPAAYKPIEIILRNNVMYVDPSVQIYPGRFGSFDWWDVEVYINTVKGNYDYLILGEQTDPKSICNCSTDLVWKSDIYGFYLYKVLTQ